MTVTINILCRAGPEFWVELWNVGTVHNFTNSRRLSAYNKCLKEFPALTIGCRLNESIKQHRLSDQISNLKNTLCET